MAAPSLFSSSSRATTTAPVVAPTTSAAPSPAAPTTSAAATTTTAAAVAPTQAAPAPAVTTTTAAAAPAPIVASSSSSAAALNSTSLVTTSNITTSSTTSTLLTSTSRSSTTSFSTTSAVILNVDSSASNTSTPMSGGTIGAIAGSIVGTILLAALAWTCWRRIKSRRDRVPPPPPRPDMSYNPSAGRSRAVSGAFIHPVDRNGSINRANSYATLLHSPSGQTSRHPSYYASYPVATPSASEGSPTNISPNIIPIEDPSALAAATPHTGTGTSTPNAGYPFGPGPGHVHPSVIIPGTTTQDDGVGRSGSPANDSPPGTRVSRRVSSVDRLRMEAGVAPSGGAGSDRTPSPASFSGPTHPPLPEEMEHDDELAHAYPAAPPPALHRPHSTQPPSPSQSASPFFPAPLSPLSHSGSTIGLGAGGGYPAYPRASSAMSLSGHSMSGRSHFHIGPAGGAPHQGRPIQLEMPRPLGLAGAPGPEPQFDPAALMRGDGPYGVSGFGRPGSPTGEFYGRRISSGDNMNPNHKRLSSQSSGSQRSSTARSPQHRQSASFGPNPPAGRPGVARTGSDGSVSGSPRSSGA